MKVFVFGSNLAGRHGAGAALTARRYWGAVYGLGEGIQGQGRYGSSYAIPTKDHHLRPRAIGDIKVSIDKFIEYARWIAPFSSYIVVKIGCGLAGFTEDQIAPLFKDAPANCQLPLGWSEMRTK